MERRLILETLSLQNNRARAARILGASPRTPQKLGLWKQPAHQLGRTPPSPRGPSPAEANFSFVKPSGRGMYSRLDCSHSIWHPNNGVADGGFDHDFARRHPLRMLFQ
jgi:hypothetical protein